MSFSYDFDIHWIIPQEVMADPAIAKMMGEIGFQANTRGNYVALFRDPRVVEALRGADPKVMALFEAAGFGFNVYDSGAGPGRYPAKDEAARTDVVARMAEAMKEMDYKGADLNGFDFGAFLKVVVEAKPVDMGAGAPPPAPPSGAAQPASIDDAFANPKAGSPVTAEAGKTPTLDELMAGPALTGSALGAAPGGPPMDDLKYRPTSLPPEPKKGNMMMLPMMLVGGLVLCYILFVGMGDTSITTVGR